MNTELLSPEQAAEVLEVTPKTVRTWLAAGDLVGIKIGKSWRIHRRDLDRVVNEQLFLARKQRAEKVYPDVEWIRGQCRECGLLMPEPARNGHWVCSTECLGAYNAKAAAIVGRNTEEFATCCGDVVPPF
ncbi:helix-turn-helix domain-containing protein [Azospirillum himalayense]|uniref:Helix-turn-helix domain-containing protein n=1 Tax=Azospirillum himalayense TaxID=654847 RepID=A0ABW0G7L7_9PROT